MKIAIVTQYYRPENAKIPNGIARGLTERGHDVRVVTAYPNYPEGRIHEGFRQKLTHHETDGPVTVQRVPIFISHSHNPVGRVANYMSFAFSSLLAGRFVRSADVVYVYATQMTAAFAPHIWRRTRGIPFVLHVQDLWPESITGSSMVPSGILTNAVNAILTPWLKTVYRASSGVIAIAPTMRRILMARGVSEGKAHVVLNWADEDHISTVANVGPRHTGLTVVYAGSLGHLQDLETVVAATRLVTELENFRVLIVGSGMAEPSLRTVANGMPNVEFRGRVRIEQMDDIYAESDFQLVTLRSLPIFRGTIPSKLQGSLAAGVPVISTVEGDANSIIESAGVGLISAAENPEALAAVFRQAYGMTNLERRRMGARAKAFYLDSMSMSAGIDQIERILKDVVNANVKKNRE